MNASLTFDCVKALSLKATETLLIPTRSTLWWLRRSRTTLPFVLVALLVIVNHQAKSQTPCDALRWMGNGSDAWNPDGTIQASGDEGVVGCGNAAATQSNIQVNSVYDPQAFTITPSSCFSPNGLTPTTITPPEAGQNLIWIQFDVRAYAGSYDYQLVTNDNIGWVLYASSGIPAQPSPGAVPANCSDPMIQIACGDDFDNTFATSPVPLFTETTNLYLVMWDQDDDASNTNTGFSVNFKARFGCGDGEITLCALELDDPIVACIDQSTYSVTVNINGSNAEYMASDMNALNTQPNICLGNLGGGGAITGSFTFQYSLGTSYNITIEALDTPMIADCAQPENFAVCVGSVSGASPTLPTCDVDAIQNVSCNGADDGSFELTLGMGAPPYDYTVTGGVEGEVVNVSGAASVVDVLIGGLAPDEYTISVSDANGCETSCMVTISEPLVLSCSITGSNVDCNGTSTGSADASVSGGTMPYSYAWSNGASTEDLSDIPAGSYTLTVTDANLCETTCMVTISEPLVLSCSITGSNVDCNGTSTGSADASVSGGTMPYSYAWSNGASTEDLSDIPAGSYTLTVTDANLCETTCMVTISEPLVLSCSITGSNVDCNGTSTGSADASVSGGTMPYSYAWSNGAMTEDLSDIPAGSYTLTVTDANLCETTCMVTISEPLVLSCSITGSNVDCNGTSTGSADASVSGGTMPYSYAWSNGASTEDLSDIPAGSYTLTVTDANLCETTCMVTISEPLVLSCSITGSNVDCNGTSTGSADASVSGGTMPYSYAWSNGASTEDLSDIPAGSYTLTVTDANLCETTCMVTISEPLVLSCSITGSNVDCNGTSTGSADASVSGGTMPYSYAWSNGASTEDLSDIPAGSYTLTVTDANLCETTCMVTISEPLVLSCSITGSNVDCNGTSTGSADASVSGGTMPYSYAWSNGAMTEDLSDIPAGSYTLTVTDANLCETTCMVTISEPLVLSCSITGSNVDCNGTSTGSADASVSGGTMPYSYAWSNGASTEDLSDIPAGSYTLTVTDANLCETTCMVTISEPLVLSCSITGSNVDCNGTSTGSADASVSGGTMPYSYAWSNGASTEDLSDIPAGSYTLTVTDANLCETTCMVTISEPLVLSCSITGSNVDCNGTSTGSADASVSGGTMPYSYAWSNGASTEDLSDIPAGSYTLTVTDANLCETTCMVTISEPLVLSCSITGSNVDCNGTSTGSADASVSGGTMPYSYAWSNGAMTEDLSDIPAGSYTLTVTDANLCETTCMVTISEPLVLSCSITGSNVDCNGTSTGSADASVSGGTMPYSYAWSNGASTEDLSDIPAGSYTLTVTDANLCETTCMVTISEPLVLSCSITGSNVDCNGTSTGSADAAVSGGTMPYSYAWGNGASTEDLSNIPAGSYTLTVTDANLCETTCMVTISEPLVLSCSITGSNVDCNGTSTGSADASVSGGTMPYSYAWSNGASTEDLSDIPAGSYTLTVTDANLCETTCMVTISEPLVLSCSITGSNVDCNGTSTGSADAAVSGGTMPYSYAWSNGAMTEDLSDIPAGSYTLTVTDANLCETTCMVTISEPLVLSCSITGSNVDCNGTSTGSADASVSGGTMPYSYAWSNGASTEDLSDIPAGSYTLTVTDANLCETTCMVTISEPLVLSCSITGSNVDCNGTSTGSADASVSGGTMPYSYAWSNGASTEDLSDIPAGSYTLTVTDANLCETTCMVTISEPLVLSCSIMGSNVDCNGTSTGSADASVSGGTMPYSYAWSNGASTEDLSDIPAGSYTLTVTDANLCETTCMVTISEAGDLSCSITGSNVDCNGTSTGSADASVSGGTMPYSYAWSNGASTEDLSDIPAGSYTLTVTDANLCETTCMVTISEPLVLSCSITGSNVDCNGTSTGSADASVSGGTMPYSYAWSNGASTEDLSDIPAGSYTLTVTDANLCETTCMVTISEPLVLSCSITGSNVDCNGTSTGSADASVSGGTMPYSYAWSNGASTEDLSDIPAGSYTLTVTDANLCETTCMVTISEPLVLSCSITGSNVDCNGTSTGSADASVSGGTMPYSYAWSNGASTEDLSDIPAGSYTLTVTDANLCETTCMVTISEPLVLSCSITGSNVDCNGTSTGSADASVSGGTMPYSYAWSNGASTEDLSDIPAGSYTLTVTDANLCETTCMVTISEPLVLSCSITGSNVDCNGTSTGSADASVSGGTMPYSYAWSNGASTEDLSDIPAGSYTLTVTDANLCETTCMVTISEPLVLSCSITGSNVDCNGTSTGSADASVSGGTMPYSYAWSNGAMTEDLSNIPAGSYTLTVTDANLCETTCMVTISEPLVLSCSITGSNVDCNGTSTGSADASVSGGTMPYSYAWSNGASTEDLSDIPAGSYTLTVTDANLCETTCMVTISEAGDLSCSITGSNVDCNGTSTGSADASVSGGTMPYSYAWSNGASTEDLSDIPAGSYTLTVTDANLCETTCMVTISEPLVLSCSITGSNVDCNGTSTGSADASVSGGTMPYSYAWSNGASTEDLSDIPAGSYTLTVTDANLCETTCMVTISEPLVLSCSITGSNVDCNGTSTGSADASVSGGTMPYSYAWSNGASTEDLSDIPAGSYTLTVTDANLCETTCMVTISEPLVLSCSITGSNVDCNGTSTGSADASVSGGTMPYSYAWSNGASTEDLSDIPAGSYTLTVTDANLCETTCMVTISEPLVLSCSITGSNVDCNGTSTGSADASVSGGTMPYSYAWSNGASTEDLSDIPAGSYTLTVTDANLCETTCMVTISEPLVLSCSITGSNVDCNGTSTGSADASVSGGTMPYSYAWSNGASTEDLSDIPAGSYTLTVTDANLCETTCMVTISEPLVLSCSITGSNVDCNGTSTGSADASVSGGTMPYSYAWSNGAMTEDLSNIPAGSYTLTVTDANLCETTCMVTISEPLVLSCSITGSNVDCNGTSTGSADASVSGGTMPYSYAWSNGAMTEDLSDIPAGSYTLTVTDANLCETTCMVTISEPLVLSCSITGSNVDCNGNSTGSADASVSGGTMPYSYAWSNGASTEDLSDIPAGSYTLTVTDANLCETTCMVTISEPVPLTCQITNPVLGVIICNDQTIDLSVSSSGGTGQHTYMWSSNTTTSVIPDQADPSKAVVTDLAVGVTIITVKVTDENGCESTCTTTIEAESCTDACTWTPGFWKNHPYQVCLVLGGTITGKGKKATCEGGGTISITICGETYELDATEIDELFKFSADTRGKKGPNCDNPTTDVERIGCHLAPAPNGETLLHHILAANLNLLANAQILGVSTLGDTRFGDLHCRTRQGDVDLCRFYERYGMDLTISDVLALDFCFDDELTADVLSALIEPLTYFNECHDDCGLPSNLLALPDQVWKESITAKVKIQDEQRSSFEVRAFPNPSDGRINLDLTDLEADLTVVRLYDAVGRFVKEFEVDTMDTDHVRLDLRALVHDGLYYLRIKNHTTVQTIPVVVSTR